MTARTAPPRRLAVLATASVLTFWVGVLTAGTLVEGYAAVDDFVSSLASRGSPVAALAIGSLLASAAAHGFTGLLVLTRSRTGEPVPWSTGCIWLAGMAVVSIAAFRVSCPGGPAGCGATGSTSGDWVDAVHGWSVGANQLFIVAAMLTVAGGAHRGSSWPRWLGAVSLGAAALSLLLFSRLAGEQVGLWQRLWVANNLGWLLVVAWVCTTSNLVTTRQPGGSP